MVQKIMRAEQMMLILQFRVKYKLVFFLSANYFYLCGFWPSLRSPCLKFFHSAGSVYDFLVAGEKRMTSRTDFHMDRFHGRTGFYLVSAGAGDNRVRIVLGMYFFFHNIIYNIKAQTLQILYINWKNADRNATIIIN